MKPNFLSVVPRASSWSIAAMVQQAGVKQDHFANSKDVLQALLSAS